MSKITVIHRDGSSEPFHRDRVAGFLIRIHAERPLELADLVEVELRRSGRDDVSTAELRSLILRTLEEHEPGASQRVSRGHASRPKRAAAQPHRAAPTSGGLRPSERDHRFHGVACSPEDFVGNIERLLAGQNTRRRSSISIPDAIDAVRVWNTIEHHGLSHENELHHRFTETFVGGLLEEVANVLGAVPTKGMALYSEQHDIMIGGSAPHPNSIYKGAITMSKTSGGISGHTLDVTYTGSDCSDCDGLQVVQVFWGTRRKDGKQVGTMTVTAHGKTWDTFVDGGKESPYVKWGGNPPAQPGKPYYLTPGEVASQVKGCSVRVYDRPGAIVMHSEGYFETAIVCTNYKKSGKDKVLKVFKWGWKSYGTSYLTSPGSGGKTSGLEEYDDVSPDFVKVVAHDYPSYTLHS